MATPRKAAPANAAQEAEQHAAEEAAATTPTETEAPKPQAARKPPTAAEREAQYQEARHADNLLAADRTRALDLLRYQNAVAKLGRPTIVQAMSRAMAEIGAVAKDGRNAQFNFQFRGVDAVVNAASPAFRHNGIVVTPEVLTVERESVPARNGGQMMNVYLTVRYTFHGPRGDSIQATVAAESFDAGDKATAKAMSVAFRIALLQALALPTHDEDPDDVTYERAQQGQQRGQVQQEDRRQPPPDEASQERPAQHPAIAALSVRYRDWDNNQRRILHELWGQREGLPVGGPSRMTEADIPAVTAVFDETEAIAAQPPQDVLPTADPQ